MVRTDEGEIKFTKPVAYQEEGGSRRYVDAEYIVLDDRRYALK